MTKQNKTQFQEEISFRWRVKLWNTWQKKKKPEKSKYITTVLNLIIGSSKINPSCNNPLFFLLSWEYWVKVHWPLSGNQLIFIQAGGEEWEECIDVWRQTTSLCAGEAWYEQEWALDNQQEAQQQHSWNKKN